jgi:hypothetical protein
LLAAWWRQLQQLQALCCSLQQPLLLSALVQSAVACVAAVAAAVVLVELLPEMAAQATAAALMLPLPLAASAAAGAAQISAAWMPAAVAASHLLLQLLLLGLVTHPWSWVYCLSCRCVPWHLLLTCLLRLQQHQPSQQLTLSPGQQHWSHCQQLLLVALLLQGVGWLMALHLLLLLLQCC